MMESYSGLIDCRFNLRSRGGSSLCENQTQGQEPLQDNQVSSNTKTLKNPL